MTERKFWIFARRRRWSLRDDAVRCRKGNCPLVAVQLLFGLPDATWGPAEAATALGLPPEFGKKVANAADYDGPDRPWLLKMLRVKATKKRAA